jgi:hypothetical protein
MAITHAQAEREPLTAHAETQEYLRAIVMPILAGPIAWTRRDRACARTGRRLIGSVQGDRRGILMQPRGREGIDL